MKSFRILACLVPTLLVTNIAIAGAGGGIITVGPVGATAVPSLSGYMLILLSLLLIAVAFRMAKNKNFKGTPMMFISTLGVAAIISASGGIKIVSDAYADGTGTGETLLKIEGDFNPITQSPNKNTQLNDNLLNVIENNSGLVQRIINIDYARNCSLKNSAPIQGTVECKAGATIPTNANGLCYVDCRSILAD